MLKLIYTSLPFHFLCLLLSSLLRWSP